MSLSRESDSLSQRILPLCRSRRAASWFLMANDEGHGFNKKRNVDCQFQATILFFQEHLLK